MAGLTPAHLFMVLIIALVVIGPGKLPEVGAAVGKSVREFQKASSGVQDSVSEATAQPAYLREAPIPQIQTQPAPVRPSILPSYFDQSGYAAPIRPLPVAPVPPQDDGSSTAPNETRFTPQED